MRKLVKPLYFPRAAIPFIFFPIKYNATRGMKDINETFVENITLLKDQG